MRSKLYRTLQTVSQYALVELMKGKHGTPVPQVTYDQGELDISLTSSRQQIA